MGEFDLTLGPLLVGIIFNSYLYGLVSYQFAAYHKIKFNDPPVIKCMVLFLFLLDSVHSISVIWMIWEYCVTTYGKPEALGVVLWPYTFTPIATALASMVTQLFLGWRIYVFSKSKALYAVVICLAVPCCALGFACGTKAWIIKVSAELSVLNDLVTAWLVLQVTIDAFVTTILGALLTRSRTGFVKTDTVINQLIRGAIQTGLFAGIFSLGDLITFIKWPNTNFYGMFAIPIGRIYTNTLLDTLLTRQNLRQQLYGTVDVDATGQGPSMLRWADTDGSGTTAHISNGTYQMGDIVPQKEVVLQNEEPGSFLPDAKRACDSV